ncbi:S8 family serine peptidase [Azohydromonas sp.]|uniref:S8 family serine peptidase n=1 Tax=Azohydromonas sp. TaxID=1872666 RepID=UPI002D1FB169|nr:S8 family serine peptidase [Azohydromonas sp.]
MPPTPAFTPVRRAAVALMLAAVGAAATGAPAVERGPTAARAATPDDGGARVIVRFKPGAVTERALAAARPGVEPALRMARLLSLRRGIALVDGPSIDARTQVVFGAGIGAEALAARLAGDDGVEWVEVDRRQRVAQVLPNDPRLPGGQSTTPAAGQWYLRTPDGAEGAAIDAVGAWSVTRGQPGVVVAVVDTGVRFDHPDLGHAAEGGKLLPGYDFVSDAAIANDGDGRDADPSDPGDWVTAADDAGGAFEDCGVADSSWHGTQVAGLVGAATDNGIGIAGAGWDVRVLPVRALGKCGGYVSDIAAGVRWAAGLSVPGVPANPHPARVINLSLGSANACDRGYQGAIDAARAAGAVVVAAAGNEGVAVNQPGNCAGVVTVAGVRHSGTKVGYSNLGPQVTLAAPAGNCVNLTGTCVYPLTTTSDAGTTTPLAPSYTGGEADATLGTSFASPLAAAAAALVLSVHPALTPDAVAARLRATARAFPPHVDDPSIPACRVPAGFDDAAQDSECHCSSDTCGAGLLDAAAAVAAAQAPAAAIGAVPAAPRVGAPVALDAGASSAALGAQIVAWRWALEAGSAGFDGPVDARTATLRADAAGTLRVRLTVTDDHGREDSARIELVASAAGGDGGGGASHPGWLLALALAVAALARTGRR